MHEPMRLAASPESPGLITAPKALAQGRLPTLDIFRGLIMALMALDHTRDFFTNHPFEPEALAQTNAVLFATRWITHFCAPMFFFLAATAAFLYGRRKSPAGLRRFLWTRGVWLILIEFTVVGTAWSFNFPWGFFGVIWALGASMLILAIVAGLRMQWIMILSILVIAGHNTLDGLRPQQFGSLAWLWTVLHARGGAVLPFGARQFVLFPLIPLACVMTAGYAFGQVYLLDRDRRRQLMIRLGLGLTLTFLVLRLTNLYGNPPEGLGGVSQGISTPSPVSKRHLSCFSMSRSILHRCNSFS